MTTSPSSDDWNKLDRETGEAMGDGYGSSLAAADINGDGFDDLLVGAPRAGDMDTGRIYVYLGSSTVSKIFAVKAHNGSHLHNLLNANLDNLVTSLDYIL